MSPTFLLDTNICIYVRQHRPAEVLRRFERLQPGDAAISIITFGDLMYGARRSRQPERATEQIEALVSLIPVLPLPPEAGVAYGTMRAELEKAGQTIGNNDLWIAAHAKAIDLTLVTNNEREFTRITGLKVENWAARAPN